MMGDTAICVFAKPPVAGNVKTRLAPALGFELAAELARVFLLDTLELVSKIEWAKTVVATTGPFDSGLEEALAGADIRDQGDGDLGARLERILRTELEHRDCVMAIGTDAPALTREHLSAARQALSCHDAVLGPADDGGYYLIGLRRCPVGLLARLPWSQPDTLEKTRQRLIERGFSVAMLGPLFDVDCPADLEKLRNDGGDSSQSARLRPFLSRYFPSISVVIPTLNEESQLGELLGGLTQRHHFSEIVVVDGGSIDATLNIAASFPGVRVISAPRGRGTQLNAGARAAAGEVLLFLHADVRLPGEAEQQIRQVLQQSGVVAGAFKTWTVADGWSWEWLSPILHIADIRSRISRYPYGDQAMFLRREVFDKVGGFPSVPLMEDIAFSRKVGELGKIGRAPGSVRVSGRRFMERPLFYTLVMNAFPILYRLGVSPERLSRIYRPVR
jgi:uncharacterized protein